MIVDGIAELSTDPRSARGLLLAILLALGQCGDRRWIRDRILGGSLGIARGAVLSRRVRDIGDEATESLVRAAWSYKCIAVVYREVFMTYVRATKPTVEEQVSPQHRI